MIVNSKSSSNDSISLFEGDVDKDKLYWKKNHNTKTRYFELKEI